MSVGALGKRRGRRGVDAIFTPCREPQDARFVIGLAGILAGVALCITVVLDSADPNSLGAFGISSYLSMVLASLGLIIVISGAGICVSFSSSKPDYKSRGITERVEASAGNTIASEPVSALQGNGRSSTGILFSKSVKLGLFAFLQSCLTSVLFSGLVDEYQSNNSMQRWLSSIFPYGSQVLSWEAVLVASALFGIIVVQFLPGRALAE